MAGQKGQKKRFWSDDEKCMICEQARVPGVSVAQVARRYSMNANLIFKWLKDPRFSPKDAPPSEEDAAFAGVFLPVEIEGQPIETAPARDAADDPGAAVCAHRVDITLSDGRRILVEGPTALSAVVRLVRGLTA